MFRSLHYLSGTFLLREGGIPEHFWILNVYLRITLCKHHCRTGYQNSLKKSYEIHGRITDGLDAIIRP